MRCTFILLFYFLMTSHGKGQEVEFSSFADWHINISPKQLLFAGDDLQGTYTSAPNHMLVSVQIGANTHENKMNHEWTMEVESRNSDWNNALDLFVRRTGEGAGDRFNKAVKGGEVFQAITRSSKELFTCRGWRIDIPIQFELRGVSVLLPAKTYSMDLIFTIIDN